MLYIYTTGIFQSLQTFQYIHERDMNNVHGIFSFIPLCSPLLPSLLTWNPPCCDRIRPPRSQVARKLTSPFPHLAHIPSHPKSRPPGFSRSKYTLIRTTLRTQPISSRTISKSQTFKIRGALVFFLSHKDKRTHTDDYISKTLGSK